MITLSNIGVPMLFIQWPVLIVTLPVVIFIEALLLKRWFKIDMNQAITAATKANCFSTIIGFPFVWLLLVGIQIAISSAGMPNIGDPWTHIYGTVISSPWLAPNDEDLHWMIPTSSILLLVPAFFATVWMEGKSYKKSFSNTQTISSISSATWKIHFASYTFLLVVTFGLLIYSLSTHA